MGDDHQDVRVLLAITSEEYSDYTVHGFIAARSREYVIELLKQYAATPHTGPGWSTMRDTYQWLLEQPGIYAADQPYDEVWIGEYGRFADEIGGKQSRRPVQ